MSYVIAVVGLCGVGKSEATKYISKKLGAPLVYFGGVVLNELRKDGLECTPSNEKAKREALREKYGMAAMAVLSLADIRKHLNSNNSVVVDGLYSYEEYDVLRDNFGEKLITISLHSRKAIRYYRLSERPVRPLTKVEVDQRDKAEIQNLNKAPPIALADVHIVNNEDISKLYSELELELKGLNVELGMV